MVRVTLACVLASATACGTGSVLHPRANEARTIASVWWLMFGLAAAVYVVVAGFILVAIRRGRSDANEHAFIWIGGIAVPVVILGVLAAVTVTSSTHVRQPRRGALSVEVIGRRWWWQVRYPGTAVETANEIHLPVGQPIHMRLTTTDVIHSFWVPEIGGKVDTIPGQTNTFDFRIDRPGRYRGQCAEFCGVQHANMALFVYAEPPDTFARWLTRQAQPAGEPVSEFAAQGQLAFTTLPCAGCHRIRGTTAQGNTGPDLTKFGSRHTIAALTAINDPSHLATWIADAQRLKPGALMPPIALTSAQQRAIVTYLESLK